MLEADGPGEGVWDESYCKLACKFLQCPRRGCCKCTLLTCLPQKLQVSVAVATLLPIHVDRRSEYKNLLLTQWMFSCTKAVEKGPRCPSDA